MRNTASLVKPPRITEEEIVPFTREEAAPILEAAKEFRNGARFVIAMTLGLRKGEALGLKWRDVDFQRRTLTIRRTVQRVNWKHGCGESDPCGHRYAGHCPQRYGGGMVVADVKSRAGRRTVGLPAALITVLQQHEEAQRQEREEAGDLRHDEGWAFPNHVDKPTHIRIDHDTWKAILRRAGVRDARLHDARHAAATMLLVLGIPQRAVMDVMGWSEASMAARYQHVTDEVVTGIADRIGGLYWEADEGREGTDAEGGETAV